MSRGRKTGTPMNVERAPDSAKKHEKYRARQEARWKAKCGPLTVRFVDPATLRKESPERPS